MIRRALLTTTAAVALAACTAAPKADVYALASALTAADRVAISYLSLPPCGPGASSVCSDPAVKMQIKKYAQLAYDDVKKAEAGDSVAFIAAQNAISFYVASIPLKGATP